MADRNKHTRASMILQAMKEIEESPLSVNQYFKAEKPPFGRAQYYLYKKALREKGEDSLYDKRSKGNNLKFTITMKIFVMRLLEDNRSMSSVVVQNAIKNENPKQEYIMRKLESALEVVNRMGIEDTNKLIYYFKLV